MDAITGLLLFGLLAASVIINIVFIVMSFKNGRWVCGLFGLFVPIIGFFVSMYGALAQPTIEHQTKQLELRLLRKKLADALAKEDDGK